jgi:2-polyprenyl-6-methoxyphenol hydroxylase-like FAD-dependent oxidoreductase
MLTPAQRHAVEQFAKSLPTLADDALIDTYHQAREDHGEAVAEGNDNLSRAYAKSLAAEKAMRDRFPDYQGRYELRYP